VNRAAAAPQAGRFQQRFDRFDRTLHGFLMLSFLGLAATGIPVLFATSSWAPALARVFGGFAVTGFLHRVFAVILIAVFAAHLVRIGHRLFIRKERGILWGPSSMVPQPRDVTDLYRHLRWFIGAGPRPRFDRYTYWEKFDYWAVFWGMGVIGASGLLLWFPEAFSRVVPGWIFNIALLVHGEEALLAVGFIFTIHFFNGHLRPEKFPMDIVIFTGRVSEHDLAEERADEYERVRKGGAPSLSASPPSVRSEIVGRIVGTIAVTTGLLVVSLILYAMLSH
jgi:cytochrome b subunit of formate dehydrogenase